jgi:hypothetical protein
MPTDDLTVYSGNIVHVGLHKACWKVMVAFATCSSFLPRA